MNAALGAGLLNFPKAFDQAGGVLVAVLVQASLLVFIMIALYILATTSDIKQSTTLQEVKKKHQRLIYLFSFPYLVLLLQIKRNLQNSSSSGHAHGSWAVGKKTHIFNCHGEKTCSSVTDTNASHFF